MIKISSQKDAACAVQSGSAHFLVFPKKPKAGERAIVSAPIEEKMEKVLSWPGEYDFDGIFLGGIGQNDGGQVSYACDMEGVRCAFVDAPVLEWTDAQIEKLGDVAVLVLVADAKEKNARALIEAVDPRMVIVVPSDDGDTAAMTKAAGSSSAEEESEVKIQASSLPTDSRKVVILAQD